MRFSASIIVALAGLAVAAPAPPAPTGGLVDGLPAGNLVGGLIGGNDLVGELTGVVSQVEKGLSVDDLEKKLDTLLGATLTKVEAALGQPLAAKLLVLVQGGLPPQIVQAVGQGLALVQQGVAIETVDSYVKGHTDGAITSLEKTLGVVDLQKVLKL
ncbi:hypothetical protein PWT90_02333 [Aphanocladium album]|nr:hypothetical protein PWT90_02333 [Aphanocladium album]